MDSYPIPAQTVRTELRVMRSLFIATVAPAATVAEARAFIRQVKREFPTATHPVYAFRVGYGDSVTEGMSDDGEPPGSAAPPLLAALRAADLGDAAVVVARYVGGRKLGRSGLPRAYGEAARLAVAALPRRERVERAACSILCPYNFYDALRRLLALYGGEILDEEFVAEARLRVAVPRAQLEAWAQAVGELGSGRIRLEYEEEPLRPDDRSDPG